MPKVKVTDTKGLVQEGGLRSDIQNRITVANGWIAGSSKGKYIFTRKSYSDISLETNEFSGNRNFLSASH